MAKYTKYYYLIIAIVLVVIAIPCFKIYALTDVPSPIAWPPIYDPSQWTEEELGEYLYSIQSGFCAFPNTALSEPNIGDWRKRKDCDAGNLSVAFCSNTKDVERDESNCNCENGLPIQFYSGLDQLVSDEFVNQVSEANCSLPSDLSNQGMRDYFSSRKTWMDDFRASKSGAQLFVLSKMDGCVENCGFLGTNCINFFLSGESRRAVFEGHDYYIYNYNHPIFGNVEVSGKMAAELMKRNNEIIAEKGYPGKCSEANLKELLGWPEGCNFTGAAGADFRPATHKDCNKLKPSQHCYGIALDFSCGEKWSDTPNGCGPKTTMLLEVLREYWKGENIIIECTAAQRTAAGTSGINDIIHIDGRKTLNGSQGSNDPEVNTEPFIQGATQSF